MARGRRGRARDHGRQAKQLLPPQALREQRPEVAAGGGAGPGGYAERGGPPAGGPAAACDRQGLAAGFDRPRAGGAGGGPGGPGPGGGPGARSLGVICGPGEVLDECGRGRQWWVVVSATLVRFGFWRPGNLLGLMVGTGFCV